MGEQIAMDLAPGDPVELAFGNGTLYLIMDEPRPVTRFTADFVGTDDLGAFSDWVRWVHVISRAAGGEIRGYAVVNDDGALRLRLPSYPPEWPEMDAAVLRRMGAKRVLVPAPADGRDGR